MHKAAMESPPLKHIQNIASAMDETTDIFITSQLIPQCCWMAYGNNSIHVLMCLKTAENQLKASTKIKAKENKLKNNK